MWIPTGVLTYIFKKKNSGANLPATHINSFAMENDIIINLKEKSFARRNIAEKREIIKSGRPNPFLKTKIGTRSFQIRWYEQIEWLCASSPEERLYCWPCLLF